ncbi:MAG TPA: Nramp family divalent metal transporter [Propionibacteriaceae bacterium]|nr:Nramp family divalent metal transporter [Propionibacteriaceae bacterium]
MSDPTQASGLRRLVLLGPAFVAAVAYVDPGNVAANLTAGGQYRYRLVWVLVAASAIAVLVQYLSAKLGIVTGRTLSELTGERIDTWRTGRVWRLVYGLQALVVSMATDIAEVIGGALGLHLLFGLPVWVGSLLVGLVALVLLRWLRGGGEGVFEAGVTGVLLLIAAGFLGTLYWAPPHWPSVAAGLLPRLGGGSAEAALAGAMLGATVMPHAIYLHSNLARDRHRPHGRLTRPVPQLLRIQQLDVWLSLLVAGGVNVAMLLAGAAVLPQGAADAIVTAHRVIGERLGRVAAIVFGAGLLVSGVGSAVVGTHAGSGVWRDLLPWRVGHGVRRAVTVVPAVLLPLLGVDATEALVVSQLVLSFGIAFALVPLVVLTGRSAVMGRWANHRALAASAWLAVGVIVSLNLWLLWP